MIETLLAPFLFPFMQNAFLIAVLIGVPCAVLSCFVVLKGWSLMGDAISHAVLPGIVLAYIAGIPLIVGAFAAGMFCALSVGYLGVNSRVKQDTVMGVVFSGMFGIGLVLYTKTETSVHLDHILLGNMLGVGTADLWTAGIIAGVVCLVMAVKWRDFLLHAFDPAQAHAVGLRTGWLHYGMLALISLTIVAVLKAVGIVLAIGLLIAPGAIAFLITRRFERMLVWAVGLTVLAGIGGVYASFWLDSAPAPTVILILTAMFLVAFVRRMVLARRSTQIGAAQPSQEVGLPAP
ncbi:metal ABC transporter permease [Tropicimonas sp. S265A]|uniref:metal ABC transporter permease n=1 Tax=Tropicimonas sp. S265A TaxID=3415134 RepID=UPI003C7CF284